MADVIRKATNKFTKGLVMDFSPENTRSEVLTHALNATFLTFNGNELSLQNDMGNARVETAYLPEGYMPVGTCEYGGIIYIVSYNPLEDKSLIGCFPSPERNISSDEIGVPKAEIQIEDFQEMKNGVLTGTIKHNTKHVLLKNDNLNPGDKFIVCANPDIYNERLSDLWVKETENFRLIDHPMIALNVVSIEDSGKIIYLNSDIRQYDKINASGVTYKYHILGDMGKNDNGYDQSAVDIDAYRDVLNSGYSVFKSKTSGKLAILAELIMIDSYSVTHSLEPKKDGDTTIEGAFDVVVHMDIEPKVTSENYTRVPKLKYYYLQNSQGYIQVSDNNPLDDLSDCINSNDSNWIRPLYSYENGVLTDTLNPRFDTTPLTSIKTATDPNVKLSGVLGKTGKFNFPKPYSYHGRMEDYEGPVTDSSITSNKVYTKFTEGKYHRIKKSQVEKDFNYYAYDVRAKFYKYSGEFEKYTEVPKNFEMDDTYTYYIKKDIPEYFDAERNEAHKDEVLYKQITFPQEAPDEILVDTAVEKWVEETRIAYIPISLELANETQSDLLRIFANGGYSNLIEYPLRPDLQYYKVETATKWISLGYGVIDRTAYPDKVISYYPGSKEYVDVSDEEELKAYWDLRTYDASHPCWGYTELFYYAKSHPEYELATEEIKNTFKDNPEDVSLFYRADYVYIDPMHFYDYNATEEALYPLFMTVPVDTYVTSSKFIPNTNWNYVDGYDKPYDSREPDKGYFNEGPIYLYAVADFIPTNLNGGGSDLKYESLRLGNIKLPNVAVVNGFDIPFQYHYTVVPCMNYGKLDHLAVSNTVDFSKLHNFNQSNFTTWKYHIDGDLLRLTFGADIYDTYELDKVDGLFLEFYDAWGFAGSISITDKKAYSGIFTKVITLNSLGALNKDKIVGSSLYQNFRRNINISEAKDEYGNVIEGLYLYNGNTVKLGGDSGGWDLPTQEDNDCGTLYSNLVYGVKTYIRTTNKTTNSSKYIPKKEFFLYTLPIYNEYYYSTNDFSTIVNPKLDLVLTYKLQDSSSVLVYNNGTINNGYCTTDLSNILKYSSGTYTDSQNLDAVRYYKYLGTSNLYLEVGLKLDYENYNLSYDPNINKFYSCTLKLVGNDSEIKPYSVQFPDSNVLSPEVALQYNRDLENPISMNINKLGFGYAPGDSKYELEIKISTGQTMFLNKLGDTYNPIPIPINYEYISGYKVDISNIEITEVPTTTVCALCHLGLNDEYNYGDFGVYQNDSGEFLSSAMFYNGGSAKNEVFGVCKQVYTDSSKKMPLQCSPYDVIESDAQDSRIARTLNSGEPLRLMLKHIGKLTFCQPHAHAVREGEGVNIYDLNSDDALGISPNVTGFKVNQSGGTYDEVTDDSHGIVPSDHLSINPKYNLSLNTKPSVTTQIEFISTIHRNVITDYTYACNPDDKHEGRRGPAKSDKLYSMREYVGLTSAQVATFNAALVQTMKNVYAYNPDYNSYAVMAGNVKVTDNQLRFTSNLISYDSKLNLEGSFNDYLYLGSIKFSNYLKYLNLHSSLTESNRIRTHSNDAPLDLINFTPSFNYCGSDTSKYLVTSLNYDIPAPVNLSEELEFKSTKNLMVKHEDGLVEFLEGTPNKKVLYGFDKDLHKLIQLDVSNYSIGDDGTLTLKSSVVSGSSDIHKDFYMTLLDFAGSNVSYRIPVTIEDNDQTSDTTVTITCVVMSNIIKQQYNKMYVARLKNTYDTNKVTVWVYANVVSKNGYSYDVDIKDIKLTYRGNMLDPHNIAILGSTGSKPNLNQQTADTLSHLVGNNPMTILLKGSTGSTISLSTSYYWLNSHTYPVYELDRSPYFDYYFDNYGTEAIELYEFSLDSIDFTVTRRSSIRDSKDNVIKVNKTSDYWLLKDHVYSVTSPKDTRLRGTSLTLNDLVYDGTSTEHRLYVRDDCYLNDDSDYRNIIYYRKLDDLTECGLTNEHKNHLYLQTGPCFTTDNI